MGSTFGSSTRSLIDGRRQLGPAQALLQSSPRATRYALAAAAPQPYAACLASQRESLRDSTVIGTGLAPAWGPVAVPAIGHGAAQFGCPNRRRIGRKLRSFAVEAVAAVSLCVPAPAPVRRVRRGRHAARVQPLPLAAPVRAAAAEAEAEEAQTSYTTEGGIQVTVRKIRTLDELRQVATLRADAYYAENQSRFVGSLKKKFVEQEVESLQQRTAITSRQGKPYAECLVAIDSSKGAVLACIDMRLPAALSGTHPHGVPQDDPHGCYLLNVVVREDVRGQGLGRGLMRAAMGRAVGVWGARQLYTHVDADNEVAFRLYTGCGFTQHSQDSRYEAASKLGLQILLQAPAAAAPPQAGL